MTDNYGMSQQVKEGVRFSDGVTFLKKYIAQPEGSLARAHLITRAFYEVYGRPSSPTEQAYWDTQVKAQQTWYVPLVSKIREELNSKPPERRTVIQVVYYFVFGRLATDGELNYWTPRKEDYKQMLEANRAWLYSQNGVKDLVETVTRAMEQKNKKKPTDSEVKYAMAKFTAKKMIYQQMIK
jgi:N1221-like protein